MFCIIFLGIIIACNAAVLPSPPQAVAYRALLGSFSKNLTIWAQISANLRDYMQNNDPDMPIYHLTAPEGWINDPNGLQRTNSGLYRRFYQYDKTYSVDCYHGHVVNCTKWNYDGENILARTWGQVWSKDLVFWVDAPGVDADTLWDRRGVFSGNCIPVGSGAQCVYSGFENTSCDVGVCSKTSDFLTWEKSPCMTKAPSEASEVNHDTSLVQWGDKRILVVGGCTFDGGNDPSPKVPCAGNAQLWTTQDFTVNTTKYLHPLTPGGPGSYWELPYLVPFTESGAPLTSKELNHSAITALMFGHGNAYYTGVLNSSLHFHPFATTNTEPGPPTNWPEPFYSDTATSYSFNPSLTDVDANNNTRRIMFTWIRGPVSPAVVENRVPYWQSAHSLPRSLTVDPITKTLVQSPLPELALLRTTATTIPPTQLSKTQIILPPTGSYLELNLSISWTSRPTSISLALRGPSSCVFVLNLDNATISTPSQPPFPIHQPSPVSSLDLHIFLDASVVEVFVLGEGLTARCFGGGESVLGASSGGSNVILQGESWILQSAFSRSQQH